MKNKKSYLKLFSLLVVVLFVCSGLLIILPSTPIIPSVKGASIWVQSTDTDFGNGSLDNLTIVGTGGNADLRLLSNNWFDKKPLINPGARNYFAMASINNDDKILLFGGSDLSNQYNDTWIYDLSDNNWTEISTSTAPSGRVFPTMAPVYNTDKIILYGGMNTTTAYDNETWIFNISSNTWTQKTPSGTPTQSLSDAMATIYGSDRVVLFTGWVGTYNSETWVYDLSDNTWTNKNPSTIPSKRRNSAMANFHGTDIFLLFGGYDGTTKSDTWIYYLGANTWVQKFPTTNPWGRKGHSLATIHGTDKILMSGGRNNQTWIYDLSDNEWTRVYPQNFPDDLDGHGMANIFETDKVILYGGDDESSVLRNETWEFEILENYGTFISDKFNTGNRSSFLNISWNSSEPITTGVKFQIRTGINVSNLTSEDFVGPDGTISTYYTSTPASIWSGHFGDKWIQFKAYLNSSNDVDTPSLKNITIIYNNLPGTILGTPTNQSIVANNKPTFTWSFNDPDSIEQSAFQVIIDDNIDFSSINYDSGQVTSTVASYTPSSSISDGIWYWKVKTKDNDGAWGAYSDYFEVTIDTTEPNSFIPTANPSTWTNNTQPIITFSTTDALSGIDHYEISIDIGPFSTHSSPYTLPSQTNGIHNITIRAYDSAGNYVEGWVDVFIDITLPISFLPIANPSGWTNNTQPIITFSTIDSDSGIDHYNVSIDHGSFSTQSSPYTLPPQPDGNHNITIRAFDNVGNSKEGFVDVFIDTVAPNDFIPTSDPSWWTNNTQPVITFSTTDATSGIDYYQLKIDSGTFSNKTSPYTLPSQPDGVHNVSIRAYDEVGNYKDGYVHIYIDTKNPESFNPLATPSGWTSNKRPVITFSTTDATSGIDYYQLKIDSGTFSNKTSPYTIPSQPDGVHNVTVRAYDISGKYTDGFVDVFIDSTPPPIIHTPVTSGTKSFPITITAVVTDEHSGIYEVKLYFKKQTDTSYSVLLMNPDDSTYSIEIPSGSVTSDGIEYFIQATDKTSPANVNYYGYNGETGIEPGSMTDIDITITEQDETPPTITHVPIVTADIGESINISATVIDDVSGVKYVKLFYKMKSDSTYSNLSMSKNINIYSAEIPANKVTSAGIEYFIKAADKATPNNIAYFGLNGQVLDIPNSINDIDIEIKEKDTTPPTIIDRSPTGSDVQVGTVITITFSEPMAHTITESAFKITPTVSGTFNWDGNKLIFNLEKALDYNTKYNVTLGTSAKDLAGNNLISNYSWEFTTTSTIDTTPPTIVEVSPKDKDVPIDSTISITFSESMLKSETESAFSISPKVNGTLQWVGETLVFTPDSLLKLDTEYNVTISTNATDLVGNKLATEFYWQFTTISSVDTTPPTVMDNSPTGVDVPINTTISVTFSEMMQKKDTETAFSISPSINGSFHWQEKNLIFTPKSPLKFNTTYKITLSTNAKDLIGNNLKSDFNWQFKTISMVDTVLPKVINNSPTGTNVPVNTHIKITFSESMKKETTEAAFSISPPVIGTFDWEFATLIFTPNSSLDHNTKYEVLISKNATDLAANNLESNFLWSFTTIKEKDDEEDKDTGLFGIDKYSGIDVCLLLIIIIIIIILLLILALRRKKPVEPEEEEVEEEPEEELDVEESEEYESEEELAEEGEIDEEEPEEEEPDEEEPEIDEDLEDLELGGEEELTPPEFESTEELDLAVFDEAELEAKPEKPPKGKLPKKGKKPKEDLPPKKGKKPDKPIKPQKGKGKKPKKPKKPDIEEIEPEDTTVLTPIEVEKEFEPELVKLEDKSVTCNICLGVIKTGLMAIKCKCGKLYHESCGTRVGECPRCDRKFILEKLANVEPKDMEELEEKEESELSPEEFEKQKEEKEKERREDFAEILSGLERRLAKGEISEETYILLRKKYEK